MFNANCFLNHRRMGGKEAPAHFTGTLPGVKKYTLGGETNVTVAVYNVLVDTKIYNVFGVIKGSVDPGEELEHGPAHAHECVSVQCELRVCFCRSLRGARRSERRVQLWICQVHRRHVTAAGARQGHHGHDER